MILRRSTFIAGFTLASISYAEARTKRQSPTLIGDQIASLRLTHLDGSTASLDEFRNRFVVLAIWATWCPPCRAEIPDLERLAQRYADQGVTVVGVDEGETAQVVSNFIKEHGITFPVLLDPSLAYWGAYVSRMIGIPVTMFVDQRGRIVRRFQGETHNDQFEAALRADLRLNRT